MEELGGVRRYGGGIGWREVNEREFIPVKGCRLEVERRRENGGGGGVRWREREGEWWWWRRRRGWRNADD